MKSSTSFACVAALAMAAAGPRAEAHARLVSATPAANAAVASTNTLTLHFSEALAPKLSSAQLMKADGAATPSMAMVRNGKELEVKTPAPLRPGTYMVMWSVVASDDGHRTKGAYNFTVH